MMTSQKLGNWQYPVLQHVKVRNCDALITVYAFTTLLLTFLQVLSLIIIAVFFTMTELNTQQHNEKLTHVFEKGQGNFSYVCVRAVGGVSSLSRLSFRPSSLICINKDMTTLLMFQCRLQRMTWVRYVPYWMLCSEVAAWVVSADLYFTQQTLQQIWVFQHGVW